MGQIHESEGVSAREKALLTAAQDTSSPGQKAGGAWSSIKTIFLRGESNFQKTSFFPTEEQLCIVLQLYGILMWTFFYLVFCEFSGPSGMVNGLRCLLPWPKTGV